MSPVQKKRMLVVMMLVAVLSVAVALVLYALKQNINLFYSPSDLAAITLSPHQSVRVGGMVVKGSIKRQADLNVAFVITDFKQEVTVHYKGILPDLFKENQGVVVQGKLLPTGIVKADQVLAKHDENYMPPEVAASLKGGAG